MDRVYSRAWNIIIWLGEEPESGAFRALQERYEMIRYRDDDLLADELWDLHHPGHEDGTAFHSLQDLLDRLWFKRTWIIQEAILSEYAYIMSGGVAVSWADFSTWRYGVHDIGGLGTKNRHSENINNDSAMLPIDGLRVASQLFHIRNYHAGFSSKTNLLSKLEQTRYAQVSQALDKIYGILALCESGIEPDYSMTLGHVFTEVALHIVGTAIDREWHSHAFWLLSCIDHDQDVRGLPSWAVDWSRPRVSTPLAFESFARNCFDAGGEPTLSGLRLGRDDLTLSVKAKVIDRVEALSSVLGMAELSEDSPQTRNSSLQEAIKFANRRAEYTSSEGLFLTLAKTLVAGKDGTGKQPYPKEFTEIFSLLYDETTGQHFSLPNQIYSARQRKDRLSTSNLKQRAVGRIFQSLKKAYKSAISNWRLCWSASGHLALVSRYAESEDLLCVFSGSPVPFAVRRRRDGDYALVGECYVHHSMHGEALLDETLPFIDLTLR